MFERSLLATKQLDGKVKEIRLYKSEFHYADKMPGQTKFVHENVLTRP